MIRLGSPLFLLRLVTAVTMIMHSIPTILEGTIYNFGKDYLDAIGFAPFGLVIAWAIKLSHIATAICLIIDRYVKLMSAITIFILVMGIVMIHFAEGWFVVGPGRNGMEFNILLIAVFLTFIFPKGLTSSNP